MARPVVVQPKGSLRKRKAEVEKTEVGNVELEKVKEKKRATKESDLSLSMEPVAVGSDRVQEGSPGDEIGFPEPMNVTKQVNIDTSTSFNIPVSVEEISSIRTTFKSALFKLQVLELLKEVSVDYKKTTGIETALRKTKDCLVSIQERENQSIPAAFGAALDVPLLKMGFRFFKPTAVNVVGSFLLQTIAKPEKNVDVAVEIPKACFHEKDFLNHRYHAKRAAYLQTLSNHLDASGIFEKVKWGTFLGEARKPILLLYPKPSIFGATTQFVIRVHATIGEDTFDVSKLVPTRNNVRSAKTKDGQPLATPTYNASILEDMFLKKHLSWLHTHSSSFPAIRDAIVLLKVWARQRDFHNRPDAFNGFLLSSLAVHLCTTAGGGRISIQMTSYQIFRVVMDFIANGGQFDKGIFLQQEDGTPNALAPQGRQAMSSAHPLVICDPTGCLNLSARVTRSAFLETKLEAAKTLSILADEKVDGFDAIFMTRVDFAAKYDYHVSYLGASLELTASSSADDSSIVTHRFLDEDSMRQEEARVEQLLTRGLGERACLVTVMRRQIVDDWQIQDGIPRDPVAIKAGILLNEPDVAFRLADVGPSADNKAEAKKFRSFWGSKAELRRFKDGTISETAVWECPSKERHLILEQIVSHVLHRHLGAPLDSIRVTSGQLDYVLRENGKDPVESLPKLLEAFEKLSKSLRSMPDLPLSIVGIQPLCSALRHCAVFPPEPHPLAMAGNKNEHLSRHKAIPSCIEPLEIAIQLEGSGKWPDDPVAIEKTKLAFCLKVAESMEQREGLHVIASEEAVDVLYHGFAFRLRVAYERDPTFLHWSALHPEETPLVSSPHVNRALPKRGPQSDYALRVIHGSLLLGLQGVHPLYAPTARLAKRWVASHMLGGVLQEEAVELIVAYLFCQPSPFDVPRSRITGFLRFLRLLSEFNWDALPIIVDINNVLTSQQRQSIHNHIVSLRETKASLSGGSTNAGLKKGGPAMYIATSYDQEHSVWTLREPTTESLKRIISYAKSSALLLTSSVNFEDNSSWQSLFCTPLSVNDAVILLRPDALPHPGRDLFPAREQLQLSGEDVDDRPTLSVISKASLSAGLYAARRALLIGFDPMTIFVQQLKAYFGWLADFWYDPIGGSAVGLSWRVNAHVARQMSPPSVNAQIPLLALVTSGGKSDMDIAQAVVNSKAVVQDIRALGLGLVDLVYVNEKRSHPGQMYQNT